MKALILALAIKGGVLHDARINPEHCGCKSASADTVCLIESTSSFSRPASLVLLTDRDGNPKSGKVEVICKR